MAEKVNIASLSIDFSEVIKKSAAYKKQIDGLKKSQKELDTTTEQGQQAFSKMDVEIKNLSKSYRDNQSFARALDSANKDLEKTMSTQNKSTQELRDSRSQLNQISKNIVGNTEEEIQLREELNGVIDEQTEALREQSSEFNGSKDQIGEYEQGITAAFDKLNIFNGGLSGFSERSNEAGGAGKLVTSSVKDMTKGMFGLIKASLAFIATPIGAVLAVLVGAFLLIKNAMNRSEEATNKIRKAMSAFTGIIKGVLKFLEPLGEFLIDGLVKGFELVEKGVFKAMKGIQAGLKLLGFDEAAKDFGNFTDEIKESAEASKELAQAEIELEKAQRIARKTQLDFQKDAEKLRQIRDDESKTIAERAKANQDLLELLRVQAAEEEAIANKALLVANLRLQSEGKTKEALNAQAEALTEISDIQERIAGQESEALTNLNSLRKEAADKQKKVQEDAIKQQEEALALLIAQQGTRAKTLEQELTDAQAAADKEIEIFKAKLKAKLISETEYNTELLTIQDDLLEKQNEIAVQNAQKEVEDYIAKNQSKLDNEAYFTEALAEEEKVRLEGIAEKNREFEAARLANGVINQKEYNDAINAINEENRLTNEQLDAERAEALKAKEAEDALNRFEILSEQTANEFEFQSMQLEASRQAEVANAEKTGADIELINKKYAARQKQIEEINKKQQLDLASETFGGLAQLLGEHTAAGKAAGIAAATINTYQGITEVWKAPSILPEPFNTASKIAATATTAYSGFAAVKKITSVKEKFARGGILSGARHSAGGIDIGNGYEAEDGEAIINRKSTSMFAPLLSGINQAGGGVKLANGGIKGVPALPTSFIDYDTLGAKVAEAYQLAPPPVVSVEEINRVNSEVTVTENDATS